MKITKKITEILAKRKQSKAIEKWRKTTFQTAKETNTKQLIREYSIDCRNRVCGLDIVRIYALPDGKTERQIYHTD